MQREERAHHSNASGGNHRSYGTAGDGAMCRGGGGCCAGARGAVTVEVAALLPPPPAAWRALALAAGARCGAQARRHAGVDTLWAALLTAVCAATLRPRLALHAASASALHADMRLG